jgi:drug/metabolite transporter (DMT)-like permease
MTVPFLALTPIFLIFTSNIILGERVSVYGGAGILLMAVGSYSLNIHLIRKNVLEPVKAILREKGCVMMIIVACIFSVTSSLGKMAIEHSSPVFFGCFYFVILTLIFTPIALRMNKSKIEVAKKDIIPLATIGVTYSMMIIFHMLAMSISNVAYMISIKRTSLLFSIFYGYLIFKEENIAEKTVGGIIMLAGFLLIVLSK